MLLRAAVTTVRFSFFHRVIPVRVFCGPARAGWPRSCCHFYRPNCPGDTEKDQATHHKHCCSSLVEHLHCTEEDRRTKIDQRKASNCRPDDGKGQHESTEHQRHCTGDCEQHGRVFHGGKRSKGAHAAPDSAQPDWSDSMDKWRRDCSSPEGAVRVHRPRREDRPACERDRPGFRPVTALAPAVRKKRSEWTRFHEVQIRLATVIRAY